MPKSRGICHFNQNWKDKVKFPDLYYWVQEDTVSYKVKCFICKQSIDIANGGVSALNSHAKKQTHADYKSKNSVSTYFNNNSLTENANNTEISQKVDKPSTDLNSIDLNIAETSSLNKNKETRCTLGAYVNQEHVTRAEILYTLCQISKQASLRCFSDLSDCLPIMFPDSQIASKLKIHKDKLSYSVTYGLGPHFQKDLANLIRNAKFFSASFDEVLNKVAQKGQMDLVVKFWKDDKVETRYLNSCFLQAACATDLLKAFKLGFSSLGINTKKLINISMDGPNVNLKFFDDLKENLATEKNEFKLLQTGTCSLHIVNGSYKTALKKSGWEIDAYLKSLYLLFKDFPTRRGTFINLTKTTKFPKKFCTVRWTENSQVIERAIDMDLALDSYVRKVEAVKKAPNSKHFKIIKKFLADQLLKAKLGFSMHISSILEKFLIAFQDDKPLLPFLYSELFDLINKLLKKVLKPEVLNKIKKGSDVCKIDLQDGNNLCSLSKVDIGFNAEMAIDDLKEDEKKAKIKKNINYDQFFLDCQNFVLNVCRKLIEKCPLNYDIVKGASCLSPLVMRVVNTAKIRVQTALQILCKSGYITETACERIKNEYLEFIQNPEVIEDLKKFSLSRNRLDVFLMELNRKYECSEDLINFEQIILIIFHGNAAVERSFSINKNFLVENLEEASLVAQRCVFDYISSIGGKVKNINITKNMIRDFKLASSKRQEALTQRRESENLEKKRQREIDDQIKIIKSRKIEAEEALHLKSLEVSECARELDNLEKERKKIA